MPKQDVACTRATFARCAVLLSPCTVPSGSTCQQSLQVAAHLTQTGRQLQPAKGHPTTVPQCGGFRPCRSAS